jgi:protein-S-isoprenylcysteine O-methyltransferase Ste14
MGRVKIGMTAIGAGVLLAILAVALLALAWIRGGTKPLHWIEQPVARPATSQGPA